MSDFVLEYESLEAIARYSRALGKSAAEYSESLEQQILAAIGNVTGASSVYLMNASDSVRNKINELKQKSDAFNHYAEQISHLLEVAKEIDQEVADTITAQSRYFLEHHESLRLEDWKAKLLDLLVDIKNSGPILSLLGDILNGLNSYIESLQDSVKHWYKCQNGKYAIQTRGVGIAATMASFSAAGAGFAAMTTDKASNRAGFVGSNPNIGGQNLSPEEMLKTIRNTNLKFPGVMDIISKDLKNIVKEGYKKGLIGPQKSKSDTEKKNTTKESNGSIPNVTYTSIDISKFSASVQHNINELLKAYDSAKTDADREYILDGLENVINYATSGYGRSIEQFKLRANGVITGALQGVGGFTEMTTGYAIFGGASWTGVGIPIGVAGGYMAVDGTSNFLGGISKALNAAFGDNEGDTLNFMKQAYKKISPEYGETIYNCTQIGIGFFTIGKGIKELPESAVQTFNRSKNIIRAQKEGLQVGTEIMDVGSKVVIVDKTQSGMILRKVVVDKSALTSGVLLIGVDTYNTSSSADSLKQK